ncbi:MAG: hypothetical protein RML95_02240 [Anaerolineae bacterium]|nr:hypothetical protein [Anaerolineae bacterium]
MSISLDPHVAERILFLRYIAPVNPEVDMATAMQAIAEFYRQVQREFFVIADVREFEITFDTLVEGLDLIRRQLAGVPVRMTAIGTSEMVRIGAEAITQKQYGGFEAGKVFATDEEAFAYCMEELRKSA